MKFSNILKIHRLKPQKSAVLKAARILQKGGLVAFPTETVYGLGANALDPEAVKKIFRAKGRPSDNPLIVHISSVLDVEKVAKNISSTARLLMKKFWPGPLTLVLQKRKIVPDEVTAGSQTVAIRMPSHPVARVLIRTAGIPIAAPSANLAGKPSPTSASHVAEDFGDSIDLILDGGKTHVGLESTVVDVTEKRAIILRNGQVTAEDLAKVLGYLPEVATLKKQKHAGSKGTSPVRSPGMKYRHYAPAVPLFLVEADEKNQIEMMRKKISGFQKKGMRIGVLCSRESAEKFRGLEGVSQLVVCGSRKKLESVAQNLFASLRKFRASKVDVIVAEGFPRRGIGHAIMDRLGRAAEK